MEEIAAAGEHLSGIKSKGRTLSTAIDRYITESVKNIGRTKAQVLRSIREYGIAAMACNEIQSHDIVQLAKNLGATRTPATVGNYMSHLGAIFAIARPAWGIPLDQTHSRVFIKDMKHPGDRVSNDVWCHLPPPP